MSNKPIVEPWRNKKLPREQQIVLRIAARMSRVSSYPQRINEADRAYISKPNVLKKFRISTSN